jgi:YYY domain-containing protein
MKATARPQHTTLIPPDPPERNVAVPSRLSMARAARRSSRSAWLLVPIALLAFALRVHGLNWDDGYHLHPDERFITIVITERILPDWPPQWSALRDPEHSPLNPRSNDPDTQQPRDFAYGSLPLYVTKAVAAGMQVATGTPWTDYQHIFLVGRALSALLDIGTLLIVAALARRYGRAYANLAAFFLAVCVLHIQLAHFFATDTWVTFFATAAVLALVRAAEGGHTRDFILAGALIGAGVASKASVAFLAFPALAAVILIWRRSRETYDATADDASPPLHALFAALTMFWSALLTFAIAEPYALVRLRTYLAAVGTQARLVRGDLDYPYTRQYVGTGLLYHLRNLVQWGMGPALGALVLAGLLWAFVRTYRTRATVDIVLIAWVAPYLVYTVPQSVKFMRYLQPVYPALIVLGVALLRDLTVARRALLPHRIRRFLPAFRIGGRVATVAVMAGALLWAIAFSTIYDGTHTRVAASNWMAEHIPSGATVATEVWDDSLPLAVPGVPSYGCVRLNAAAPSVCTGLDFYPDEGSGDARLQYIARALGQSDYIVMSSNRLYGSIPKLPWRYPVTIRYYDLLFGGELGFTKVYDETVSPHLGPWVMHDQHADESFTVYDHPRVTIFQKTRALSLADLRPFFADTLDIKALPQRDPPGKSLLLSQPVETLPAVSDRGWAGSFGRRGVVAVAAYLLLFEVFGLIGWAVASALFRRFPDRGWGLAKLVGWLGSAYIVWIGASLRIISFTLTWCGIAVAVLFCAALALFWRRRAALMADIRVAWRVMAASECIALVGFALFLLFRLRNPDLWQTYWGGEKPFELAHINAILRSAHFPPYDPWFAGGYINYYYFGSYLHAFVMKLTGVAPEIAFNVAVPITMAVVWGAAFSIGAALWTFVRRRTPTGNDGVIAGGAAATAAVALVGNLDAFGQVFRSIRDGLGLRGAVDRFDFWESTRIIPGTINEFPFFSGLWADLHAHVVALPFALLAIALGLATAMHWHGGVSARPDRPTGAIVRQIPWPLLATASLTIGALYCINAWDFPTALALVGIGLLIGLRDAGRAWPQALGMSMVATAGTGALAYLLYLPFFTHFQSLYGALARVRQPSPLGEFLVIFGAPCLAIGIGIALMRPAGGWFALWGADARTARLAIVGVVGAIVALLTHRHVLVVTLPLLTLLAMLWLRADGQPGRRMLFGLAGVGLGLVSVIEIVFLADDLIGGDFERMNTVFKFDFQAWTLLMLAAVGFVSIIVERWRVTSPVAQAGVTTVLIAVVAVSLFYPAFGTPARLRQRMDPVPAHAGLNGNAWMETGSVPADQFNNSGSGEPVFFADDLRLIDWMNANVRGTPVVAEASIGPYRGNGSRISSATGFPTIIGWERHEEQQRDRTILPARVDDVRRIYTSSEARAVQDVLDRYHVRYIVVGDVERKTKLGAGQIGAARTGEPYASPVGLTTLATMADQGALRIAWQSNTTILYEVTGGWRMETPGGR